MSTAGRRPPRSWPGSTRGAPPPRHEGASDDTKVTFLGAPGTATTAASPNLLGICWISLPRVMSSVSSCAASTWLAQWRTLCWSAYEDAPMATSSTMTCPCSPAKRMSSRRCGVRDRRAPRGGRTATSRCGSTRWHARRAPQQAVVSGRLDHDVFDEMFECLHCRCLATE
jgi:hypothetical protein